MCTGACAKFIAIPLYVLAAVSVICNIILFFPDFDTKFAAEDRDGTPRITEEVKYMGGLIGGGIMVSRYHYTLFVIAFQKATYDRQKQFMHVGFWFRERSFRNKTNQCCQLVGRWLK